MAFECFLAGEGGSDNTLEHYCITHAVLGKRYNGSFRLPIDGRTSACVTLGLKLNSSIGRPQQLHSTVQIAQ